MTSTLTIYASADCWVDKNNNFDNTDTILYVGESVNDSDKNPRDWFLFTVPLSKNQPIISADLYVTASQLSVSAGTISVGCEDATSPATPTTGADLNGRAVTGMQEAVLEAYAADTLYHYDVDSAVAAVLARSDWVYGSNMACIIDDVDTAKVHRVYSVRNGSASAYLVITVNDAVPRSGGWF
jgi:hypothetical protein